MFVDSVAVVRDVLQTAGWVNVHPDGTEDTERISAEALSGDDYVWLEEEQGTTPHILYSDRPTIRVILYAGTAAQAKARQIQHDIARACVGGTSFSSGGIHRILTLIRPYRQDIVGIPPGVVRISALYELVLSTQEKWD